MTMRNAAPLPHQRSTGTDGRVGIVDADSLRRRIARARAAKAEACGAVLLPTQLKAALDGEMMPGVGRPNAAARRCADCKNRLPETEFYRAPKTGYFSSYCRECLRKRCAKRRATPAGKAARAAYDASPAVLERRRKWRLEQRKSLRAAGLPTKRRTLRSRLAENLRKARQRLARPGYPPGQRAKTAALVLNLIAEIERIDRNS